MYNRFVVLPPALLKSNGLRLDGRIDDRSFWLNYVSPLPTPSVIPLIYPRMIAIHDLGEKVCNLPLCGIIMFLNIYLSHLLMLECQELEDSIIPEIIPLSSKHISDEGIYLLENGVDCLVYVGNSVQQNVLTQFFSISSVEEISNQVFFHMFDDSIHIFGYVQYNILLKPSFISHVSPIIY